MRVCDKKRDRSTGCRCREVPLSLKSLTGRAHILQTDGSTQTQGKITGNALSHSENKRGVRVHSLPAATDVEVCVYLRPQTLSSVHEGQLSAGFVIVIAEAHAVIANQTCFTLTESAFEIRQMMKPKSPTLFRLPQILQPHSLYIT